MYYTHIINQRNEEQTNVLRSMNLKFSPEVKEEFDAIAKRLWITPTAAINIFVRQFIDHRGFPFSITLSEDRERRFAQEMDRRFEEMEAGLGEKHDLI